MSQYYNPVRKADWNYGGNKWRLSRSKIDLFVECARCFYLDNKLGTARPKGYPFNLNTAVDTLLKKEFDIHRSAQTSHPLVAAYGLDLVPLQHPKIDIWRENFKGVDCVHKGTGMTISGAIDDLWVGKDGTVHVVDYKATSKDGEVSLDAEWQDGYKRQMEIYQWLLRQNGLTVSDTGYFVYVNGQTDREAFDGKLEFDVKLIPYTGSANWVDAKIVDIKACLDSAEVPKAGANCDYCSYRTAAGKSLQAAVEKTKPLTASAKKKDNKEHEPTLFG